MKTLFKGRHIWWQLPKVRTDADEDKERKATWLELFYDLIFVGALAELSHLLLHHTSIVSFLEFSLLFAALWFIWNGSTFYNERFEVNDVRHRLFTFLKMIPVIGMIYSIDGALHENSAIFAISYVAGRAILIYLWLTAASDKLSKKMTNRFAMGFLFSAVFWLSSLFVHEPMYIAMLWTIGLLIDYAAPATTMKIQAQMPRVSTNHLPERFGLFTILTLGETVIASAKGVAESGLTITTGVIGVLGLLIAFLLWWVYFDHVVYRPFKNHIWSILGWCYFHMPITLCITAVGAATLHLVGHADHAVHSEIAWLMCGAIAAILIIMSIMHKLSIDKDEQGIILFHKKANLQLKLFKIIGAIVAVAIPAVHFEMNPMLFMAAIIIILLFPALNGLNLWVKSQLPEE